MRPRKPIPRSPLPPRTARPKAVNRKRKAKNHERAYGSKRAFVVARECVVCGYWPTEAAHSESGGMGRKADSATLVPLCGMNGGAMEIRDGVVHYLTPLLEGCHRESHRIGIKTFQRKYGIDLNAEAARIEREWHTYSGGDDGE